MTIDELVNMAKRIHDVEGWRLGASSTRETRNDFWARVIGCAYHGHPVFNPSRPDRQWHLKKASEGRPQTDDVATCMPSRQHWDCIQGAGADGYYFSAVAHGHLSDDQIVYAPPVPAGAMTPPQPPAPTAPAYPGDAYFIDQVGIPLEADYQVAGQQMNAGSATWFARTIWRHVADGMPMAESVAVSRKEWRQALGLTSQG